MRAASVVVPLACRVFLGAVFLLTGLAKIADPVGFLFSVRQFRLLPGPLEAWCALVVPWLEFLLALLLLSGLLHRTAALMLAALNLLFAAAIVTVVARGIEIDCGCFGLLARLLPIPDGADAIAVVRNLLFVGACLPVVFGKEMVLSLEEHLRRTGRPR